VDGKHKPPPYYHIFQAPKKTAKEKQEGELDANNRNEQEHSGSILSFLVLDQLVNKVRGWSLHARLDANLGI